MSRYLLNPELPVVKPGFKGNHFADGRFKAGEGGTIDASYLKVLRWQLSSNPQKEEKKNDTFKLKTVRGRTFLQEEDDVLVWLGHASFFIRINGIHIITDPCLSDLPFVKRQVELPCSIKEINKVTGAPDICLLPIGAYKPGFIMQEAHLDPKEAVEAFHDLKGNTMIPMHYGTYDLSDEPMGEPVKILKGLEQQEKIQGRLRFLDVGEEFKIAGSKSEYSTKS